MKKVYIFHAFCDRMGMNTKFNIFLWRKKLQRLKISTGLIGEYDIKVANDIHEALNDLLYDTIQGILETE